MNLNNFITESNKIEGIFRDPTDKELAAHQKFLALTDLDILSIETFVMTICGQKIRNKIGMNVRVGKHIAPYGGPSITTTLEHLLIDINTWDIDTYKAHIKYEMLHPFMDGNGRSGRAIWAWMMQREGENPFHLGFLHTWYYQTLENTR